MKTIYYSIRHIQWMFSCFLISLFFQISFGQNSSENNSYVINDFDELPKPAIANSKVFFGSFDGYVFETESFKNHRKKYFKPDGSYRDDIYSIIKSNEQFLDVECELGGIFSTPVIFGNYLVFSSTNGCLYCLEK